jgi:hypothetical protein
VRGPGPRGRDPGAADGVRSGLLAPCVAFGPIAGEVDHRRRPWLAIHFDHRPGLAGRDRDGGEFLGGRAGLVGAEHDIAVRGVDHKFEGHDGVTV